MDIDIYSGNVYDNCMKSHYFTSYITPSSEAIKKTSYKLSGAGEVYIDKARLRRLDMTAGEKVNVGLTRGGLALAMSPSAISDTIDRISKDPFLSQHDKDMLCWLYEDFGEYTEQREVDECNMLIIPSKIRKLLHLDPKNTFQSHVATFEDDKKLFIEPCLKL